jgi:hypothetical protein
MTQAKVCMFDYMRVHFAKKCKLYETVSIETGNIHIVHIMCCSTVLEYGIHPEPFTQVILLIFVPGQYLI